jgi:hypothetical protein
MDCYLNVKKVTQHFDKAFGIKATEMGDIYDAIEETINERVKYE